MDGLVVLSFVVAALAFLGVAAMWLGAETRPGFEDRSFRSDA